MKLLLTSFRALFIVTALTFSATVCKAHQVFDWENLQGDIHGVGEQTDPNVVNPWGIAFSPSGLIWVADNGAGVATVYYKDGSPAPNSANPLMVTIPASATNPNGANPTGLVSNTTSFFQVTNGSNTLPAKFIFVSEDGMISGWNPNLNNTQAYQAVDNGPAGAIYKGATLGVTGGHNFLYATNFSSGQVETYNENFVQQSTANFPFIDPNLPVGYAPFGIRNLKGTIYVTFAPRNPANPGDDLAGPGNGVIDAFNTNGQFLRRVVSNGRLNAPWGLELISGALWVGNFGDGRINVYNPNSGAFLGTPKDVFGNPLDFDGLWGLLLGRDGLYFTAGIADEQHGIMGIIFETD
jgi:uncharacterized protein (TIGR03118 family)